MWQGVVIAFVLIVLAGLLVAIEAALSAFSKARAEEFKLKLDALIEIDRRLRREAARPRR